MKKQYNRIKANLLIPVIGISVMLFAAGCDVGKLNDAVDDFNVVVSLDPINTAVAGQFVDVSTGELIEQDVTVTFTGDDGDQVVDMFSEPLGDLTISEGLMTFGISNENNPTTSNPVKVNVVAEANGYTTNSYSMTIDEEGNHQFLVYMKPENTDVEGSTSATGGGSAGSDGSVSTDVGVETSGSGQEGGTGFTVSAGTKAMDEDGNTLSGDLQAKVTHFNPQSETAQRLLPGDLPVSEGNTFTPVTFNNLEMTDSQGRRAKTFSNAVNVSSKLPEGLVNPRTGQSYQEGEEVNVFSFDESVGEWVSEGTRKIEKVSGGNGLQVNYQTDHFSSWMLGSAVQSCQQGSVFNIDWQGAARDIQVKITPNSDVTGPRTITVPATTSRIRIPAPLASIMPANIGVKMVVMTSSGEVEVGPSSLDLCGQEYNVQIPVEEVIDGEIQLSLSCPSNSENVNLDNVPTSAIYYRRDGATGPWNRFGNSVEWDFDEENSVLNGGTLQVNGLLDGEKYYLKTVFDGETYQTSITLADMDENFRSNSDGTFTYSFDEQVEGSMCN